MSKAIFLDIDGVLNDISPSTPVFDDTPAPRHIQPLVEIVNATGAKLILSSSWRKSRRLRIRVDEALARFNLTIADITPELSGGRGREISAYLEQHPEITSFLILDDDDWGWAPHLIKHWVQTSPLSGLLPRHIKPAITILDFGIAE